MRHRLATFAMVGVLLCWATSSAAGPVCQPKLTVEGVSFSTATNLRRYWSATVSADASQCAKRSGLFALGFVRAGENAPDLEFQEPFIWYAGQTKVRVELWADETVERYWLADVASCPCRE